MEWIVARWLTFIATLVMAGSCAVALGVVPRAGGDAAARDGIVRGAARAGVVAGLLLIPALLVRLAGQLIALRSPGDPLGAGLGTLLGSTTWGAGFAWQAVLALATLLALWFASRHVQPRPWLMAAAPCAAGLCAAPAWQGHAIGSETATLLAVAMDVTHVSGASLWLGSLLVIAWLGSAIPDRDGQVHHRDAETADVRLRLLVPLVPRVALAGAALLLSSGVASTVLHVTAVDDLWRTSWGQLVLGKTLLACVVVGLGALNWRRLGPQVESSRGTILLRRALFTEVGLALVVLLITAVLVETPLPGE
ncbi:MAG: CopD family protein [Gemmatimonadaceae bacterium]|nr:CopD family protein [Gemmatimonadaceae bacterium]